MILYQTTSLRREFKGEHGQIVAVKDVSLKIEKGEMLAVMGPSGCGKTTLLHVLGLLDRNYSGELKFDGTTMDELSERERANLRLRRIGFVFQNFNLLGGLTVLENVALPHCYCFGNKGAARKRAREVLEELNLEERVKMYPSQLSSGQQQRVAVARALVNDPLTIIADEPTAHLDEDATHKLASLFASLAAKRKTVVMATHDAVLAGYANRTSVLRFGEVAPSKEEAGSDSVRRESETTWD